MRKDDQLDANNNKISLDYEAIIREKDKRIEELESSLSFHELIYNNSQVALMLSDKDGNISLCNQSSKKMFGCRNPGGNGKHDCNVCSLSQIEIQDKEQIFDILDKNGFFGPEVMSVRNIDQTEYMAEINAYPVTINEKVYYFFIFRDVSDIVDAKEKYNKLFASEQMLRKTHSKIKSILDNIPYFAWLKDTNGRYIAANKPTCDYYNLTEEEMLGKTDFDLYPANIAKRFDQQDKDVIKTKFRLFQEDADEIDGRRTWLEIFKSPIIDESGMITGVTGIARDITERKLDEERMRQVIEELSKSKEQIMEDANKLFVLNNKLIESEEQLKQLNTRKDKFFSIIAHDLRSLLTGFTINSDFIRQEYDSLNKEEIKEILNQIGLIANSFNELLTNLLDWAKLQMNRLDFNPEIICLRYLVQQCITVLVQKTREKNLVIENNIDDNIAVVADSYMLSMVIRNLIYNAIKFSYQGGKIVLSVNQDEQEFIISVTDFGVGIKEEDISKLFRIDTKYSTIGTKMEKGSGLGLILCKEFIEKHGGRIWVDSTSGLGTKFYFSLPR